MNCFGARQGFVSFWQRTMPADQRAGFVAHLQSCQRCDRSFRIFALTAPVLHASGDPMVTTSRAISTRPKVLGTVRATRTATGARKRVLWAAGGVGAVAAAIMAAYVASARPSTAYALEQSIIGDDSGLELTSFTSGGELFGQDSTAWQDSSHAVQLESPANHSDDFAG